LLFVTRESRRFRVKETSKAIERRFYLRWRVAGLFVIDTDESGLAADDVTDAHDQPQAMRGDGCRIFGGAAAPTKLDFSVRRRAAEGPVYPSM
jgi:hypothetical protein